MKDRYKKAGTFQEFLATAQEYENLWLEIYERARLPEEARKAAASGSGDWHLLASSPVSVRAAYPTSSIWASCTAKMLRRKNS